MYLPSSLSTLYIIHINISSDLWTNIYYIKVKILFREIRWWFLLGSAGVQTSEKKLNKPNVYKTIFIEQLV